MQCNLCGVEVSLKKLEHHTNLRCRACGHHHRHHGTLEYCGSCIKQCKKCGPFHGRLRSIQVLGRQRCGCGHYHANGRICNSFTDLSPSISTSLPREHHSDSDSTVQSTVSCDETFKRHTFRTDQKKVWTIIEFLFTGEQSKCWFSWREQQQ